MDRTCRMNLSFLFTFIFLENITPFNKRPTGLLLSGCPWPQGENVDTDWNVHKHRRLFQHVQKHSGKWAWPGNTEAAPGRHPLPAGLAQRGSASLGTGGRWWMGGITVWATARTFSTPQHRAAFLGGKPVHAAKSDSPSTWRSAALESTWLFNQHHKSLNLPLLVDRYDVNTHSLGGNLDTGCIEVDLVLTIFLLQQPRVAEQCIQTGLVWALLWSDESLCRCWSSCWILKNRNIKSISYIHQLSAWAVEPAH